MRKILTISKITFIESLRDRIFAGLVVFLGMFFVFSVYISSLSLGTPARFIQNSGMLGLSLICLMVTVLFGMFSLYREKDRKEVFVMFSRIPRHKYLLGRFFGASFIIVIFSVVTGIGVFLLTWYFGNTIAPAIFWAVYWAILEFSLLTGIGILFYSMGVSFTLNSLLLLAVFIIGHSLTEAIQSFIGLGRFGSKIHLLFVKSISYLVPNFDMFDFRLAIVHGEALPLGQVFLSTGYWFFYLVAILGLSTAIMNRRDV